MTIFYVVITPQRVLIGCFLMGGGLSLEYKISHTAITTPTLSNIITNSSQKFLEDFSFTSYHSDYNTFIK